MNEEQNLPHVLSRIPRWVQEVLVVDGHSTDNTVATCQKIRPDVRVIYQPGKGKGDALQWGIRHARGSIIVTLDADGATDPGDIDRFIEPLLQGYDFAKGSRFLHRFTHHKPFHRIIGNWIITLTFNLLFWRWYTDMCSGYNAFWKKAIERISIWPSDGFENEPFINTRARKRGLDVIEVAHTDFGRLNGDVKEQSWRQGFKAMKTILRERFHG
jgi:glycosyltransferase involved in cell wall biosynthesis